eukprot:NODE_108_length_19701_cov_0.369452.p15 type:complete len:118 gc:universal NODE_108_length_19701_cov_0.369452:14530-14177(-)
MAVSNGALKKLTSSSSVKLTPASWSTAILALSESLFSASMSTSMSSFLTPSDISNKLSFLKESKHTSPVIRFGALLLLRYCSFLPTLESSFLSINILFHKCLILSTAMPNSGSFVKR